MNCFKPHQYQLCIVDMCSCEIHVYSVHTCASNLTSGKDFTPFAQAEFNNCNSQGRNKGHDYSFKENRVPLTSQL